MSAASFIASSRVALPAWMRTCPMLSTSRAMLSPLVRGWWGLRGRGVAHPTPQGRSASATILVLVAHQVHDLVVSRRVHEVVHRDVHRVGCALACAVGELVLRDDQVGGVVEVRDRLV